MSSFNAKGINEVSGAAIKGWRGWKLTYDPVMLRSLGVMYKWAPVKTPAMHLPDMGFSSHDAPLRQCGCGYWGMKTLGGVFQRVITHYPVMVIGSINMWGRVFECEFGYRSEFAYPDVLYVTSEEYADHLRRTYNVDVVHVNRWHDIPHLLRLQQGGDAEAAA